MAVLAVVGFLLRRLDRDTMQTSGRWIAVALLLAGLVPQTGCRICADCEDLAYPAYGGAWQRTKRDSGRVGSLFDPAGGQAPELVNRDQPPTPDELERTKQQEQGGGFDGFDRPRAEESPESQSDRPPTIDPTQDLLDRDLDDIRDDKEDDLRSKQLEDINIEVIPRGESVIRRDSSAGALR